MSVTASRNDIHDNTRLFTEKYNSPGVSVIMPVHNGARFVEQAARSIMNQVFQDFEFIIINDGSTDRTCEILSALAKEDQRIKLVQREQKGLIASLNEGLALAKAPFVARMDADDIAVSDRLVLQIDEFLRRSDLVLLGGQARLIDENNNSGRQLNVPTGQEATRNALVTSCPFIHPSVMFRREAVLYVGSYREQFRHAEDYDLWLRISNLGEIDNLSDIVLEFRRHGENVTDRYPDTQALSTALALESFLSHQNEQTDPAQGLTEPPKDLGTALALLPEAQSRRRFNLSYYRSLTYSGAIKQKPVAERFFSYLSEWSAGHAKYEIPKFTEDVVVRALMQFLRFRQYHNAMKIILWSVQNMPVSSAKAFVSALRKRLVGS